MKLIVGYDLGTASIGWAVIEADDDFNPIRIVKAGCRIIPMSKDEISDFNKGILRSTASARTQYRGTRRIIERSKTRRCRLLRVLQIIGFLPKHYEESIDRYGKFLNNSEPKIAWAKDISGKMQFLFMESFNEMLADFQNSNSSIDINHKIPYDWTIFYLRKKALHAPISKNELAWVILHFNKKRGYYQQRSTDEKEEKDETKEKVEYIEAVVTKCEASNKGKKDQTWYNIHLDNGLIYRRTYPYEPEIAGRTFKLVVTTKLDDSGNVKKDKEGNPQISISTVKDDDWNLIKTRNEELLNKSNKTVGEFIYDSLKSNPAIKVHGDLITVIERDYYETELKLILDEQSKYHPELTDKKLYRKCLEELYPSNEAHKNNINNKDIRYLISDDILMYQRPLKSQKGTISNCPYETIELKNGVIIPRKCVSKSNPFFKEFRLWHFLSNLKIICKQETTDGTIHVDVDRTNLFLPDDSARVDLFKKLYDLKTIKQDTIINHLIKDKSQRNKYRWNFAEDKEFPCNETRSQFLSIIKKCGLQSTVDLIPAYCEKNSPRTNKIAINESELWYLLYSIKDKKELKKAMLNFTRKKGLPEEFAAKLANIKPYKSEYASYSLKAIKRLLPIMRRGELWAEDNIDKTTLTRINKIIDGEADDTISTRTREKAKENKLTEVSHFKGLPLWTACYVVYNRHAEASTIAKWESPQDVWNWIYSFKHNSLRNPVVEKVVLETMKTAADIWQTFGKIDEIHVELGRQLKNDKKARESITRQNAENEATNRRIYSMLSEFHEYCNDNPIQDYRPNSPSQEEIFKIYEDGAFNTTKPDDKKEDIEIYKTIRKKFSETKANKRPTISEVKKYRLWLEQRYRSPYTGEIIPLSKLFTPEYQIEHIIPQSVYFNDSFTNKVICEANVNQLKGNQLGFAFIKKHQGTKVEIGNNKFVTIFQEKEYVDFVTKQYSHDKKKLANLLTEEIPDEFIDRQLNDTRYISKYVKGILSNIVREANEQEATSRNVITCVGQITSRLKKDWGIVDKWNELILPRFLRLQELSGNNEYTFINKSGHLVPCVPNSTNTDYKRVDHRHHAMDAIIIACATRNHINLLNNLYSKPKEQTMRNILSRKLRRYESVEINGEVRSVAKEFIKPWDSFPYDVFMALNDIIASFKYKVRILKNNGNNNFTPTKSLHKDTYYGLVNLRRPKDVSISTALSNNQYVIADKSIRQKLSKLISQGFDQKAIVNYFKKNYSEYPAIKNNKITVYYFTNDLKAKDRMIASRKKLIDLFEDVRTASNNETARKNFEKNILKISDTGIQKILRAHYNMHKDNLEFAFSEEGIMFMNDHLLELNEGRHHKPIFHARRTEVLNKKYPVGHDSCKASQYVEADECTNLYFGIYEDAEGNRSFQTISYIDALALCKAGQQPVPEINEKGNKLKFYLSPNDLVYLPTSEEIENKHISYPIDKNRIYRVISFTGTQIFFLPVNVASVIVDKLEFDSLNKKEKAITGEMIKNSCTPIKVDRLGNITFIQDL